MMFHQNIDTLVQFLFSIMSVFIRIKVLNIQVQGGLNKIYFAEDSSRSIFERVRNVFTKSDKNEIFGKVFHS